MTIDTVYRIWLYVIAKNKSQGYGSPEDFNLTINQGGRSYSAFLLGSIPNYRPGKPLPAVQFGENAIVRQRLSPTIYNYNLNIDSSGFSPYPGDYLNTDTMWSIYGLNRIRYAAQEKLYSIYNSKIDPYQKNPFYLIEDVGFRFYPQSLGQANLNYVRNPPDMIWGYTLDTNNRPVYSAANSVQPVWDDASILEIICRALKMAGINLQLGVVEQYAQDIIKNGQ